MNLLLISLSIVNYTGSVRAQSYSIKTILTSETVLVPGNDLRATFIPVDSYTISNNGDIVLLAGLSDGSVGLIRYSNRGIELLVKTVIAQTLNENAFLDIGNVNINDKGEIFLFANYSGKTGLYKLFNNEIIPLYITGDPINGLESTIERFLQRAPSLNNNGEVAFPATLSDGNRGLFLFKELEGVKAILIEGDQFSVSNGNETLVIADEPTINDKSEIVFRAAYFVNKMKKAAEEIFTGIFLYSNGKFIPIKLPFMEAPGTSGNVFLPNHLNRPYLGNNSQIIYLSRYCNPNVPANCNETTPIAGRPWGLFLWSEGNTVPLVLPGDPAPGTNGSTFVQQSSLLTIKAMNDFGDIAVWLRYDKVAGIFLLSDDKIVPVLLFENPLFNKTERPFFTGPCGINNHGDIVFQGVLQELPPLAGLFLAVREDVPFEVIKIEPTKSIKDARLGINVTGTGFQPGATVSLSGNGIRVLKTNFKTSTNLVTKIFVVPTAENGFRNITITNPTGETTILQKALEIR